MSYVSFTITVSLYVLEHLPYLPAAITSIVIESHFNFMKASM